MGSTTRTGAETRRSGLPPATEAGRRAADPPVEDRQAFVVPVAALRRQLGLRWERHCEGVLAELAVTGSEVPRGAAVAVDVVLEAVAGGVTVVGTVRAPWVGACRRCLSPVTGRLDVAVRELYAPGGDGDEIYPLEDEVVDLSLLARDAVVLELPPAPLCKPTCRGLCPECGANRNRESCRCQPARDLRWAALDVLRERPRPEGPI
ncbi:DUF177 domain-containing protein [Aciditerrimonas ferrireducens]|jgi:uncharacterized protein|uniref:DUF177 domain-containing protein n=1 Tax=Aciditerrimonas ferrireducens TaxID=667306 RepID=A0ABV6C4U0_9ACTN|nr:DUF177 domain-containing protein [Aciditerrimonas ferrireducens]MCK4177950.1 DUF177 domain-containing protein [Aciditerrimonas ferrireducens]